jgi:hypothetical protein
MSAKVMRITLRHFDRHRWVHIRRKVRRAFSLTLLALLIAPLPIQGREASVPEPLALSGQVTSNGRTVQFAGRSWNVKTGCGKGPGPNCWSDSEESVWVDGDGLHLKMRRIEGTWHCAEVSTVQCASYGLHRFYLIGRPDLFDKNVVLGLFLYKDDDNEIDIEFSEWGEDEPSWNAEYVVQPYYEPGHQEQFTMTLTSPKSTHSLDWSASDVRFKSTQGVFGEPLDPEHLIHEWTYSGADIPVASECLRVHINLWLFRGTPPSDSQEAEITLVDADLPPYVQYLPAITKLNSTWITVTAESYHASGRVGPSEYCNENYKVAVYALKDYWYVQPYVDDRKNIPIRSDCTWEAPIRYWDQVAAHLVPASYDHPSTVSESSRCPPPPLDPASNPNVLAAACHP